MLSPSPRIPVRWPSQTSVGSNSSSFDAGGSSAPARNFSVYTAAELGDLAWIKGYLVGGGNVNKRSKEGYSILHLAAMRDQQAMVELLLKNGGDPDVHDKKEGLTPLMWAAQLGHSEVVRSLLEGGADLEQEDGEDLTALHWAARLGQERVLLVLIDHAADVEAVDYDGNTPLIWAARGGHRVCVGHLLDHGASTTTPDENGNTALHFSCQTGDAGITSDLLDWGALATAQDYWKFTPFHRACSQGHGDVLVELLRQRSGRARAPGWKIGEDSGDEVFGGGLTSAWGGSGNLGEEWGARGGGGRLSLRGGGRGSGSSSSASFTPTHGLLSEVVDIRNHFQATPLHRAAAKGHAEVVRMLVQNGANVDARDGFFYTPLHLACINGAVACVEALLRAGADPSPKALRGVTPLIAARKPEVRELLKKALAIRKSPLWAVNIYDNGADVGGSGAGSGNGGGGGREGAGGGSGEQGSNNGGAFTGRRSGSGVRGSRGAMSGAVAKGESGEAGDSTASINGLDLAVAASAVEGAAATTPKCLAAAIASAFSTAINAAGGMDIDDDGDSNVQGEPETSGDSRDDDGDAKMPPATESDREKQAAAAAATRGRQMSRPPSRQQGRRVGSSPLRPRRSSTGTMLQKLFNSSSGPYHRYDTKDQVGTVATELNVTASFPVLSIRRASSDDAGSTDPPGTAPAAVEESGGAPGAFEAAEAGPPVQVIPPETPLHMAPRFTQPRRLTATTTTITARNTRELLALEQPNLWCAALERASEVGALRVVLAEEGDVKEATASATEAATPDVALLLENPAELSAATAASRPDEPTAAAVTSAASIPDGRTHTADGGSSGELMALAIVAVPTATAVASTTDAIGAEEGAVTAVAVAAAPTTKKRRAKSLPPSSRPGRGPPRRPRLQPRPCLAGPSRVIETLTLGDDDEEDGDTWALSQWLHGVAAPAATTGGGGGEVGDEPPRSPVIFPHRRASTIVG